MKLILEDDEGVQRVVLDHTEGTLCTCGQNGCPAHTGWAKLVREVQAQAEFRPVGRGPGGSWVWRTWRENDQGRG